MNDTLRRILGSEEVVGLAHDTIWTPEREMEERIRRGSYKGKLRRILQNEVGAITAPGLYGLTLEKFLIATALPAGGLESETAIKVLMTTDTYTHDYNLHDFRNDVTDEVTGTGYTAGGQVITATEITLAAGLLTFDAADVSWASSTIANAMAAVGYFGRGGVATADEIVWLSDFVTAASTTNGTFTIQWHANGIFTIDYTP